jgi:LmbE family N-acetylglucosaminyl deacetylase
MRASKVRRARCWVARAQGPTAHRAMPTDQLNSKRPGRENQAFRAERMMVPNLGRAFREPVRRIYLRVLREASRPYEDIELGRSAIVFAPHQDDETLGCGGTIVRKTRCGADVSVVYMTDGSGSHTQALPKHELMAIRTTEALAACARLGLPSERVRFLGFEDGALEKSVAPATAVVADILGREKPSEIYIPYRKDAHPDHIAANQIVVAALRRQSRPPIVHEYGIWFWYHWPLVSPAASGVFRGLSRLTMARLSFTAWFRLLRDFRSHVCIADVLECKRAALWEHKSQMTRLSDDATWQTFDDVARGEFLDFFFQDREFFFTHGMDDNA